MNKWLIYGGSAILVFLLLMVIDSQAGKIYKLEGDNKTLTKQRDDQIAITADYEKRINSLHELDTKHTTELTNAKAEIDQLRIAAERNPERVYIRASCPKGETNTTSGLDDGTAARPTDSAIRNYWLLRERIVKLTRMVLGLQDYIRTECLR
ncbi:lysis protein [Providencia sp. CRE-3FA-0001]|uniref:Lysis protein n=1 Tax=Providencia huashanensis TaxID=3037798 RepID=A0AA42FNM5_9GAMM|nr:lysis protein [Providencia sp. CRE-3FA-0001]ELR5174850.1 lysis protein [Providencia rettgeri]ELR5197694.1 lysis protein [Providencia rettgeri]MDG4696398.1 lysis protein [Providencia sp. CRE-3FA-0001]